MANTGFKPDGQWRGGWTGVDLAFRDHRLTPHCATANRLPGRLPNRRVVQRATIPGNARFCRLSQRP